jgi:hypothetical protein
MQTTIASAVNPSPAAKGGDASEAAPWLDVDWSAFDPWRIQPVRHRLTAHPLLKPFRIVEFGARHERSGRVRTHSSDATAGTPFNDAPSIHPNARSAAQTLADIEHARAWMSLLNIQTDPVYRTLVDAVLDEVRPRIEGKDPGMCYRGGWIFVTSPNTVTPFHMDKEHNFLVQIHGRKRIYVWDHRDRVAVPEAARDLFHDRHSRELIVWREELRSRAHVFELEPGMGCYMPSTSPHMVENLDNGSITASFTYYTDATRRDSALHCAHQALRDRGWQPPPVGGRPWLDRCLLPLAGMLAGARHASRPRDDVAYAEHLFA